MSESTPRWSLVFPSAILAAAALLAAAVQSPASASGWTLRTLYSFCAQPNCADGRNPGYGDLVMDENGNVYGTTERGGPNSSGTVFKVDPSGDERVLYAFCASSKCNNGRRPVGGLALGLGNILWGTTYGTGSLTQGRNPGGVLYEVPPGHSGFTNCILARPTGCNAGEFSVASPIYRNGYLYGTASWGGSNLVADLDCCGTVFTLITEFANPPFQIASYSFCSLAACRDGARPEAPVMLDASGNVYGTTVYGGLDGGGTVFEVTEGGSTGNSTESVLYSFCSALQCTDGWYPHAGLVIDVAGNFYGTTAAGGAQNGGVAFKLTPGGSETVLYSFCSMPNCADGSAPQAGLVRDNSGNLFGTTKKGGANNAGTVFEISSGGQQTVLYSFCSAAACTDGKGPLAGLLMDQSGNLFGTTFGGGANGEGGTVFELSPPS